jgi:hypothetical protein
VEQVHGFAKRQVLDPHEKGDNIAMRLATEAVEALRLGHRAIPRLTEDEQRYVQCVAAGMTFQEMAVELGWTYHQVVEFGGHFLYGDFEQRKEENPLFYLLKDERKRYLLLLMRACKVPDTKDLMRLYEQTGDDKYHIAFVKVILDRLIDKMGIRAKLEDPDQKPN